MSKIGIKGAAVLTGGLAMFAAACGGGGGSSSSSSGGCDGKLPANADLEIWWHQGAESEVKAVQDMVTAFNSSQTAVKAKLTLVPEADYGKQLDGAAAAKKLPGVVDTDASKAFKYAWNGNLQPIDNCLSADLKSDLLPSIIDQGTYANKLWAVGMFDSGLGMYASKKALAKVNATIPTSAANAWTADQFTKVLKDLKAAGYQFPLDLKKNYGQGEWYAFGFAPIVWSSGGDLVNRKDYKTAEGSIDSADVVKSMTTFQSWFKDGLVDDNKDDKAFITGRSAISWVGHWQYNDYKKALGDDLVVLPLPNFGKGSKTGQGSWQWAVGSGIDADVAWKFIEFTMNPANQKAIADAAGTVPARKSVAATIDKFKTGGDLNLFVQQLETGVSEPRPPHPAYFTISDSFNAAIQKIIDGADVKGALTDAAKAIDADLAANKNYPAPK
ncbi:MAG: extracellular solute-binding protein [Acidimicrobiia bacterium]